MGEVGKCWCGGFSSFWEKSKPSLAMITVQIGFAGMNIISKIALNQGMSHFVLVFYRHLVATIVTAPLAYILERKTRPKLTQRIFCEIFISSLFGITLNQNFYYAGLNYTTATFASALTNLIPTITFLMAVIFGVERVDIKSLAGQAKILGTLVCVGGAMIMTFYKGLKIQLWPSPFHLSEHNERNGKTEDMSKGSLFVVISCIFFSAWFILKGVVASRIAFSLMTWCIKKKGSVFATMFNPLMLIIVALMGSILLDEKFHLGSVIGGTLIVIGLYSMLWGKGKEMKRIVKIENTPNYDSSNKDSTNMQQRQGDYKVEAGEAIKHKQSIDEQILEEIIIDSQQ